MAMLPSCDLPPEFLLKGQIVGWSGSGESPPTDAPNASRQYGAMVLAMPGGPHPIDRVRPVQA
jgi:hypothetical protein